MDIELASLRYVSASESNVSSASLRTTEAFHCHYLSVYRYLYGCTRDASEAEDLAQDVFVRLYQQLREGKEISQLRPWLFAVAHNLAVNFGKSARNHRVVLSLQDHPSADSASSATVSPACNTSDQQSAIAQASLDSLSPRERRCLELRAEGLSYREIADVVSISISSVTTYLTRAIRKIKEQENVSGNS